MGVINIKLRGPSVNDVMTFGHETFPNAPEFPCVRYCFADQKLVDEVYEWCINQFGDDFCFKRFDYWYFTYEYDALLFRLTWIE